MFGGLRFPWRFYCCLPAPFSAHDGLDGILSAWEGKYELLFFNTVGRVMMM